MPAARINTEIRSGVGIDVEESIKAIRLALAEIYSGKNLGLNFRVLDNTIDSMDVSDAVIVATGSSGTNLTLPSIVSWSTVNVSKSPIIIIYPLNGSITITPQSTESINAKSVGVPIYAAKWEPIIFYVDYNNNCWRTWGGNNTRTYVQTQYVDWDMFIGAAIQGAGLYIVDHVEIASIVGSITIDANAYLEIG